MARVKISSNAARARFALAGRIAALRAEMFGERGRAEMARRIGPAATHLAQLRRRHRHPGSGSPERH